MEKLFRPGNEIRLVRDNESGVRIKQITDEMYVFMPMEWVMCLSMVLRWSLHVIALLAMLRTDQILSSPAIPPFLSINVILYLNSPTLID